MLIVRDVDLESNSQRSESLLYRESPDVDYEKLKSMKGLEHLAKLSDEERELMSATKKEL